MTFSQTDSGAPGAPEAHDAETPGADTRAGADPAGTNVAVDPAGAPTDPAAPDDEGKTTVRRDSTALLVHEGDIAGDFLEQFLDIIDFDGDLDMDVEGERASVAIVGDHLAALIGPRGATLDALQELTRLAVLRQTGERSRLMLDVGGYRAQRRMELVAIGKNAAEQVKTLGDPVTLDPMNPFERKVVHDAIAAISGVRTESEGEEPDRRVVILPVH